MVFENFVDESLITLFVFFFYFLAVSAIRNWLAPSRKSIPLFILHIFCYLGLNDSMLFEEEFQYSFFLALSMITLFYWMLCVWSTFKRVGYIPILVPAIFVWIFRATEGWTFVGISFIAVRMSYLAFEMIYRSEKVPGFFSFFNYLFFLPTLLMGPINPYSDFRRSMELDSKVCFDHDHIWKFFRGFIKFFIFTPFFSSLGFGYTEGVGEIQYSISILLTAGAFSYLVVYFQFSGFCDMMISFGRCLGFEMKENFLSPLLSRNPQDHWRRWHVSLMEYFREVFFYPLLLKLQQVLKGRYSLVSIIGSTFLIFLGIGFWHGAGTKYLLFGAYHAAGVSWILVYDKGLRTLLKEKIVIYQKSRLIGFLAWAFNLVYLSFGYLIYFYGMKLFSV